MSHSVANQAAFILHTYPYRETSLVVEAFTATGRVALIAKGAKRPRSALRGVLQAFQPILLSWSGKHEMKTLISAECSGSWPILSGDALLMAFYLNELLLKLLPRDDPHPQLFAYYEATVKTLAEGYAQTSLLRRFEQMLIRELGYGLQLEREADSGLPLNDEARYYYVFERGPQRNASTQAHYPMISGRTLLAMSREDYEQPELAQEAKLFMREVLDHYLERRELHSRQIWRQLKELTERSDKSSCSSEVST